MVKRSKKSKSKRIPLRKKHKIIKKVKEHHKKQAKEAKKKAKLGIKPRTKIEKDPGIPNAWPFKEQELAALEARRARILEELEQKKAAKKERAAKRKAGLLDEEDDAQLSEALRKAAELEAAKKVKNLPPKEAARRMFYKEFMKVIEASDVVIQVLDARDPIGTRCVEAERMVHEAGPSKRIVLVLNKIDHVPREVVEQWLKYFREELPTVAFKCNLQEQQKNSGKRLRKDSTNADLLQTSNCLGAENLLQLLKSNFKNQKTKKELVIGVVGYPNVGKSSLINSLKRTQAVSVGAHPGVTKVMQEVPLDKHLKILDCPGIVISASVENEASASLLNLINVDQQLSDSISPVKEILRICPAEKLMTTYKIAKFSDVDGFLTSVGSLRGKLKKGGEVDKSAAARSVLHDWNGGKIPYYTSPPVRPKGHSMNQNWLKEFEAEKALKNEASTVLSGLKTLVESRHVQIQSRTPLGMDIDDSVINDESMAEDDSDEEDDGVEDEEDSDEEEDDDEEMDTAEVAKHKGKQENGKVVANVKKSKDEPAKAKQSKKPAVGNGKASSKKDSKASDDYDFNTDYTEDKVNGEAEEDDDDDDEEGDEDEEDDDDDDEESMED